MLYNQSHKSKNEHLFSYSFFHLSVLGLRIWGKASVSWDDRNSKTRKRNTTENGTVESEKPPSSNENLISEEESYFDRRVTVLEKC